MTAVDDESDLPCCDFPSVHVLWMGGFGSQLALFMKTVSRHLSDMTYIYLPTNSMTGTALVNDSFLILKLLYFAIRFQEAL